MQGGVQEGGMDGEGACSDGRRVDRGGGKAKNVELEGKMRRWRCKVE